MRANMNLKGSLLHIQWSNLAEIRTNQNMLYVFIVHKFKSIVLVTTEKKRKNLSDTQGQLSMKSLVSPD